MVEMIQIAEQKGAEESERRSLLSNTKFGGRSYRGTLKYIDLSRWPMVSPNSYMTCTDQGGCTACPASLPCMVRITGMTPVYGHGRHHRHNASVRALKT